MVSYLDDQAARQQPQGLLPARRGKGEDRGPQQDGHVDGVTAVSHLHGESGDGVAQYCLLHQHFSAAEVNQPAGHLHQGTRELLVESLGGRGHQHAEGDQKTGSEDSREPSGPDGAGGRSRR